MFTRQEIENNFQIIQEALLHLSMANIDRYVVFESDKYAEGLIQKANLQLMTIRNISERGNWYSSLDSQHYRYIIDPLSVATMLRGAYECMLTLNHVFVNPPNQDEVELRYLLWALSTFISKDQSKPALHEEGKARRTENREAINETVNYLMTLPIVQSLDEKSRNIIRGKSATGAGDGWEYYVDGTKLERVKGGWHGLAERIPAHEHTFDNLYKLFSISAHSTWHSVNVVVHAFKLRGKEPDSFGMMDAMLNAASIIGSFTIYEYYTLFTEVQDTFRQLPTGVQEMVNLYLSIFKGDEFRLRG